jgi:outer membrane autotransporter protein
VTSNSFTLDVLSGGSSYGGALNTNGTLTSTGNLSLSANSNSTVSNETVVSSGNLIVNGTLTTPDVMVNAGGLLGGSGTINGNVIQNGGIVSPSDPSIMHVVGNYLVNAGTLLIQIGGTAGAGVNPNGNDQVQVGGVTVINPVGTTLSLQEFNGYTSPARGDAFTIISGAPGSISGHFGTFTSNFATDMVLDLATGQVIGTGLANGQSILNAFPGATANQLAMINSLQVGDHQYAGGDFISLLLANPALTNQIFDESSPEAYAGLSDYAIRATRSYLDTARSLAPLVSSDGVSLFAGYAGYNGGSNSSQNQADYKLNSNGGVAGARLNLGDYFTAGVFAGFDSGSVDSTYLNSAVTGEVYGVFGTYDPLPDHTLVATTSFTFGDYTTKGTRNTATGASNFSGVKSTDYTGTVGVQYAVIQEENFSVVPEIDVSYSSSSVDGFAESNGADSFQALHVKGQNNSSLRTDFAVNGVYLITPQFDISGRLGVSHDFESTHRSVTANVVGEPTTFTVQAPGMGDTEFDVGVGADYNLTEQWRLHVNYQAGFAEQAKMSNSVSAGASYAF